MHPMPVPVLLVQPVRDDRGMYAEFLRDCGFEPIVASTAADALRLVSRARVVVTELLLPGRTDGFELIAKLRRSPRTAHVPIVVLTSCAWHADRDRALAAGCDVFLAKPCLPDQLVIEVRRVLRPSPAKAAINERMAPVRKRKGHA